jgi:hypothetical protein
MSEVALSRRNLLVGAGATVLAAALPQISPVEISVQFTVEWTPLPIQLTGEQLDKMAYLWGLARQSYIKVDEFTSINRQNPVPQDWEIYVENDEHLRLRLLETINGVGERGKDEVLRCYDDYAWRSV